MKRKIAGIPVLLLAIAALSGCQAFFTTSFASGLKRTSFTVPADISNADAAALLNETEDPAILASLLAALNAQAAAGDTGSASLAAEAAISVSGVSESITSILNNPTVLSDPSAFVAILEAGYGAAGVSTALLALNDPVVAAGLEPTELLVAAVLLAASQLDTYGIDVNNPDANAAALSNYQADTTVALALDLVKDAVGALPEGSSGAQFAGMLAGLLPMEATP